MVNTYEVKLGIGFTLRNSRLPFFLSSFNFTKPRNQPKPYWDHNFKTTSSQIETKVIVPMHRNFRYLFYLLISRTNKNGEESFLPFVNACFRSRDMSFQSLKNLQKKCEKKTEHFAPPPAPSPPPFTKIVTAVQVCTSARYQFPKANESVNDF